MESSQHPLACRTVNDENDQEDILSLRPRSASLQTRRSWPLLPTLQVINSIGSNNEHGFSVRRPTIDEIIEIKSAESSESETSISSEFGIKEKEEIFDNDVIETLPKNANRIRSSLGGDSTGTLVEAALDQAEARDRHVRFPDHIAEAGSLVQRMISTRFPSISNENHNIIEEIAERNHNEEIDSLENPPHNKHNTGSGSVLASLMKLESQRRPTLKRRKTIKRKKVRVLFFFALYKEIFSVHLELTSY
jgi:hypothetical protein